jgi:hypothetical protein
VKWDYRVVRHRDASNREQWVSIHTVVYSEGGEVIGYSQEPESCAALNIEDLRLRADMIKAACDKDILVGSSLDAEIGRHRKELQRKIQRKRHLSSGTGRASNC